MRVTTVLNRQVVEVELLGQILKILTRGIAHVGPNYVLRILSQVTDVRHRTVFGDLLRGSVEAGDGNQGRSLRTAQRTKKRLRQCNTSGGTDAAEEKPI